MGKKNWSKWLLIAGPFVVILLLGLGIYAILPNSSGVEGLELDCYVDKAGQEGMDSSLFYRNDLTVFGGDADVIWVSEEEGGEEYGGYFYMYTGRDIVDFLEYANIPMLQAVWDTGHGTTEGSQYDNIVALGKHLQATHIHDNNGQADEHFIPYTGALNLDSVMNALLDINYQGYFTFEAIDTLRRIHNRHVKRQPFERDTRLLEPTLEMQIDLERLLYTIGKHCLSAYGVFEE